MTNDRIIDPDTGNPMSLREITAYGASIQRAEGLAPAPATGRSWMPTTSMATRIAATITSS
jgi:hypothetical protein